MEDIEDMFKDEGAMDNKRPTRTLVKKSKLLKQQKKEEPEKTEEAPEQPSSDNPQNPEGHLPGSQSVFVKTYGCSHNISDSEYMAGLLADYGFTITDDIDKADACLLNSCTVKNPSQEKFINLV